jgi:hypothetical protein
MTHRADGPGPARQIEAMPTPAAGNPPGSGLRIKSAGRPEGGHNQRRYKWLKLLEIAVAASLPVVAAVPSSVWVTGGLAAVSSCWVSSISTSFRNTGSFTAPQPRR